MIERVVCVAILAAGIGSYCWGKRHRGGWCDRYLTVKRRR